MFIGFSVENFKSFNSKQIISFAATKIAKHKDHVATIGNRKILKSALIYGANASGKSNLIEAVNFSRNIILSGMDRENLNKKYFRIDQSNYNNPGVFEYRIIANEIEYSYGIAISYSKSEIISEWLIRIEASGKEFTIFDRGLNDEQESEVNSDCSKKRGQSDMDRINIYFEDFGQNISEAFRKRTMLSDIANRGNDKPGVLGEIFSVYAWFQQLLIILPNTTYIRLNDLAETDNKRTFFEQLITYFDTGIEKFESVDKELDIDKLLENMPHAKAEQTKIELSNQLNDKPQVITINNQVVILRKDETGNIVYRKLLLSHGNNEDPFEFVDESDGTRRLFDLAPLLYKGETFPVVLIDEIDRSIHTNLVRKFLELYYAYSCDTKCQLIATTHDSNLMDLDLVRQDEIWFVNREENHSSCIYSLNKFKERYDKKVKNEYLLGRYQAIPVFRGNEPLEELNE